MKEIIDIVSVIALFGFLNRWNDTMGTVLEEVPESFVENKLRPLGWTQEKKMDILNKIIESIMQQIIQEGKNIGDWETRKINE